MYKINFKHPIHIHFIGIGGISMSSFAELLHTMGFTITGSDTQSNKITKHLESLNIQIIYSQTAKNITSEIDLVVYTAAISKDNEELSAARSLGIPTMDRAEMVGQVMSNYENAIAISGTHGKTTTTSMLSHIFLDANLDPTISVGGILQAIHGNLRVGHSNNFITEACEYTNSFLKFNPTMAIILNIEAEHLDFFKDLEDVRNSFCSFAKRLPEQGCLVINDEIDNIEEITQHVSCHIITYSTTSKQATYFADKIGFDNMGNGFFDLLKNGTFIGHIQLSVPGLHNISNALAAIALACSLSIPIQAIQSGLLSFHGTDRRFQYKGELQGVTIIDDYAHHPTEIRATLSSAEKYPHKTLWCVFQPHTYSRTRMLLDDFADALSFADKIVLTDIYAAREMNPGDISSKDLQKKLSDLGKEVYYFKTFKEIEDFLLKNCTHGDMLITMGAGDVVLIGESLLSK